MSAQGGLRHSALKTTARAPRASALWVEHLVEPGELDPDSIDTPSIFIQRVVTVDPSDEKRIERRTTLPEMSET
jgi:3-oxoacid CoA-transferase subunit A